MPFLYVLCFIIGLNIGVLLFHRCIDSLQETRGQFSPASVNAVTTVALVSAFVLIIAVSVALIAIDKGWRPNANDGQARMSLTQVLHGIAHGYDEDYVKNKDLTNNTIIFFKFGCKDCEAIHDDLLRETRSDDIRYYFVNTKSSQGKALLEQYSVKDVPSAVYVLPEQNSAQYVQFKLYQMSPTGDIELNAEAISLLRKLHTSMSAPAQTTP